MWVVVRDRKLETGEEQGPERQEIVVLEARNRGDRKRLGWANVPLDSLTIPVATRYAFVQAHCLILVYTLFHQFLLLISTCLASAHYT